MAKSNEKIYMPMGAGGLLSYYSEQEKVLVKLTPKHVVGMVVGLIIIEILLKIIVPL